MQVSMLVQAVTKPYAQLLWLEDAPENHSGPWKWQMIIYVSGNDNKIPRKGT